MAKLSARGRERDWLLKWQKQAPWEDATCLRSDSFLACAEWRGIWKVSETGFFTFCSVLAMPGLSHEVLQWKVNGSSLYPDSLLPRDASHQVPWSAFWEQAISPCQLWDPQPVCSTAWLTVFSYSARQTQAVDGVFSGNFPFAHNSPMSLCPLCSSYPGS